MANQEFKVTTSSKQGLMVEAETRGFKVIMDEPDQMGGSNQGMTPVELLLASLGGCISITIAAFSKAAHVELKDVKVHVSGDLDPDGFMGINKEVRKGFSAVRYEVEIVTDAPEERVQKLMQMVEDRCPVSDTLKGVGVTGNVRVKVSKE